jgi:hypothetical protein
VLGELKRKQNIELQLLNGESNPLNTSKNNVIYMNNADQMLQRIRELSRKARKRFDDLPDMRTDGTIKKVDMEVLANDSLAVMVKDAEQAGFKLEANIVGVALRVVMLDPDDATRTKIVTTEIAITHPKVDLRELMAVAESMNEIDANRLIHGADEPPYEPKSKYDGLMYG